jgi:murein DD-endopeptidase MepM/ murein hydrolase activator NlpD
LRDLRDRLAVVRHRMPARLAGRGRPIAVGVAALAVSGLAALGVAAANMTDGGSTTNAADHAAERLDAARADRGERPSGTPDSGQSGSGLSGSGQPSAGQSSPNGRSSPSQPGGERTSKAPVTDAPRAKSSSPSAKASPSPSAKKPAPAWVLPMPDAPITSCYGQRWGVLHAGMDYALPPGTPVRSIGAGTVIAAGWAYSGYGVSVVVDHGNGYQSHYAHLSGTEVSIGQRVSAGTTVGYEGSTGDSTGPHLHFEIHNGMWNQVDPAPWLRARGVNPGGC